MPPARTVDQSQSTLVPKKDSHQESEVSFKSQRGLGAPHAGKLAQPATSGERAVAFQAFWNLSLRQAGSRACWGLGSSLEN